MQLAKVIGTVVATRKHEALEGVKLLIVQPMTPDGKPKGRPVVAADGTAMAGPGETVFVIAAREGSLVLEKWFTPVDHGIVGIVDQIYVAPGALPSKPEVQHKDTTLQTAPTLPRTQGAVARAQGGVGSSSRLEAVAKTRRHKGKR